MTGLCPKTFGIETAYGRMGDRGGLCLEIAGAYHPYVPPLTIGNLSGVGFCAKPYDRDFATAARKWKEGYERWKVEPLDEDSEFWEYDSPPDREYYRPAWSDEERTHYQMYETTSEGTPISLPMESPEELARWLADTKASAFAGQPASYEHWLRVCQGGYAPSAVAINGRMMSGVEGIGVLKGQSS